MTPLVNLVQTEKHKKETYSRIGKADIERERETFLTRSTFSLNCDWLLTNLNCPLSYTCHKESDPFNSEMLKFTASTLFQCHCRTDRSNALLCVLSALCLAGY